MGSCFGYFTALLHLHLFTFPSLNLCQTPTPSFATIIVFLVVYPQFVAHPLRPPSLILLILVSLRMGDTFGGPMGVPITSIFSAILAPRRVLFLLLFLLDFCFVAGHDAAAASPPGRG